MPIICYYWALMYLVLRRRASLDRRSTTLHVVRGFLWNWKFLYSLLKGGPKYFARLTWLNNYNSFIDFLKILSFVSAISIMSVCIRYMQNWISRYWEWKISYYCHISIIWIWTTLCKKIFFKCYKFWIMTILWTVDVYLKIFYCIKIPICHQKVFKMFHFVFPPKISYFCNPIFWNFIIVWII